jgi:hypothetical protein
MRRLLVPSLALLAVWAAIAAVAEGFFHVYWFGRAALLIVSPLWFIAVYLALVLLTPLAIRLHQRFGPLVLVILAGLAALVDVLRFGQHAAWAALINLIVVWALCHQLGFYYRTLADGDRSRGPRRPVPVPAPRARRHRREPLVTAGRRIGSEANGPARA